MDITNPVFVGISVIVFIFIVALIAFLKAIHPAIAQHAADKMFEWPLKHTSIIDRRLKRTEKLLAKGYKERAKDEYNGMIYVSTKVGYVAAFEHYRLNGTRKR